MSEQEYNEQGIDETPEHEGAEVAQTDNDEYLAMARDAFEQSSDWFDASVRPNIEKAMAHFSNRHAPGSKYYTDSYKFRAKGFQPKTRSTIRRNEAAAAVAFFSTQDMVSIQAEDDADKAQVLSAAVLTELVNYRLDDTIPWFLTCVGAYQDALNVGVVISHQHWDYEEEITERPVIDEMGEMAMDDSGQPAMQDVSKILSDKPVIDLVAIENIRISPAADWTNAMGTTPYIIEMIPMYIGDIKEKMEDGTWISYDDGEIKLAVEDQYDTIRAARDGKKRSDGLDVQHATTDFDTVFVHRNIVRKDGDDVLYYTLGTELMLSEPVPLRQEYRHLKPGERPYVMGFSIIEAHKTIPVGLNELTSSLQEEANEVRNQRRDNVSLILNKRYFARRTANVDYKSLTRNVPGSVTLVDDINADIRWDSPPEVTGSSYQEQDRISLDYDELAGAFSPGSVQSNRAMNETVGGMNLLSADANVLTEYQLRVFAETWVEPVLKQLVRMEQAYETDAVILGLAGSRAKAMQKFGINQVTDALLQGMVTVRVNVGFGSTNPDKRVQKLMMGMGAIGQLAPMVMQGLDAKEVITEIFGALGYKGAERFFPKLGEEQQDPQIAQMQQMIQQLQQQLQSKQMEIDGRIKVAEINNQGKVQAVTAQNENRLQVENMRGQIEFAIEKLNASLSSIDKRLEQERNQIEIGRLQNERAAVLHQMKTKERELLSNPQGNMAPVLSNDRYGMVPGAGE